MDFFGTQKVTRRRTAWLVVMFALAVAATIAAVYFVTMLALVLDNPSRAGASPSLWRPGIFVMVAGGTLLVIGLGSLFKILELGGSGEKVALMLGGEPINAHTSDAHERKLLNVVEEMAIASGTPVPQVFVMRGERGINAFAAGTTSQNAVIGVTSGCIRNLTRDELQGVVAHEFSHILNGDMRLNIRLIGWIFGIMCLAEIGRVLLETSRGSRRSSRDKNPLPLIGLALLVVGSLGALFGRLMQAAISRQREYLADASAVQFTRNPQGIGGALKKIGGWNSGSRVAASQVAQASHMFFGNALTESWVNLFSTHPPLAKRIRAIDPGFDGKFIRTTDATPDDIADLLAPARPAKGQSGRRGFGLDLPGAILPAVLLRDAGAPTARHLEHAALLRAELPEMLTAAAHEPFGAVGLMFANLLSADTATRQQQRQILERAVDSAMLREVDRLAPELARAGPCARLPLVEMALPVLQQLSAEQFRLVRQAWSQLIDCDGEVDLFEFTLQRMLLRHLDPHFTAPVRPVIQYYVLKPVVPDCEVLLSALARLGVENESQAEAAFRAGCQSLGPDGARLRLLPASESNLTHIDAALNRLTLVSPQLREVVLRASAHAAAADGVVRIEEAELLRAIADTFGCPLPPFIDATARPPAA